MELPTLQLRLTVEQELLKMLARQLDFAPNADELPFTAQVMTDDLAQHGLRDSDVGRLREAFQRLGPTLQRWPTARVVIEALPKRPALPYTRRLPDLTGDFSGAFHDRHRAVKEYIAEYRAKHPEANTRQAIMSFLRERDQLGSLPPSVKVDEGEG